MKKLIISQKMSKIFQNSKFFENHHFLATCSIANYEDFRKSLEMKYSCAFKPDRQT